jgi:microsomal dipeptidase-like Zn-dependent dipeptidase
VIADLHIHYPMHLISDPDVDLTLREMAKLRHRRRLREWARAWLLKKVSEEFNYPDHSRQHRVDADRMRAAGVKLGFSVLYVPTAEFQVAHWADPPQRRDAEALCEQLKLVEQAVNVERGLCFAHDRDELERGLDGTDTVLVHCVEGGFHLGERPEDVERMIGELKRCGVVYVTLAHLFWRQVATNANALPFLRDDQYHCFFLFHEPADGLTRLGEAAVRAMHEHRMLIDLSHMSEAAMRDTFDLLEKLEGDVLTPVLASHAATRRGPGGLDYNLSKETVQEIARRGGVVGLIMGDHIVTDGLRPDPARCGDRRTRNFRDSFDCLREHVDTLWEWCGESYDHIGIGSDLDGFIKPTLAGIDYVNDLDDLEHALSERYGPESAAKICSDNALRLLREYVWA